jgi:hypothetical protein
MLCEGHNWANLPKMLVAAELESTDLKFFDRANLKDTFLRKRATLIV